MTPHQPFALWETLEDHRLLTFRTRRTFRGNLVSFPRRTREAEWLDQSHTAFEGYSSYCCQQYGLNWQRRDLKLEEWINQNWQEVEGTYFKCKISTVVDWLVAFEMVIFNYCLPSPVISSQCWLGWGMQLFPGSCLVSVWEAVGTLISKGRAWGWADGEAGKLESGHAFPRSCHYPVGFIILFDKFWIPTMEVMHILESLLKTFRISNICVLIFLYLG